MSFWERLLGGKHKMNKGNNAMALIIAAQKGRAEIVKALLEAKADVNAMDTNNLTALWKAVANGHMEIVSSRMFFPSFRI